MVVSCENAVKDTTPPAIHEADFLPADCDIYYTGDTLLVHWVCEDDAELGNYNIEIHNNFDHHTHGTSNVDCDDADSGHAHGSVEAAWVYNQDYAIPRGQKMQTIEVAIAIPAEVSEGDYHFMLRLTDHAGWQTLKAVPIHLRKAGE
ncbi:MAG: DUF4625 domain-containing protein [Paludibacteraceae bacterium]|nr:DUF4625 domain-containing protein [Paludibacteraceae bacterium]